MPIRPARPGDESIVLRFIRELAEYEKLLHEVRGTEDALREHLFGSHPACEVRIAEDDGGEPVGFALFFPKYSTFECAPVLHLEDLYVVPGRRGAGHGKAPLVEIARIARERGCARLEWCVLDWNEPAIRFYESLGAKVLPDWKICRVDGAAIGKLADS